MILNLFNRSKTQESTQVNSKKRDQWTDWKRRPYTFLTSWAFAVEFCGQDVARIGENGEILWAVSERYGKMAQEFVAWNEAKIHEKLFAKEKAKEVAAIAALDARYGETP